MARFTHMDRVVSDHIDDLHSRGDGRQSKAQIARLLAEKHQRNHDSHLAWAQKSHTEAGVFMDHGKLTKADKALLDARRAVQAAKASLSMNAACERYAAEREGGRS